MVLITCLVVIMRYGMDMGSVFLQDVVLYLHGSLFLLGAAFALKRGAHVRGLPFVYIQKSLLIAVAVLLSLQSLSEILKSYLVIKHHG